MPDEPKPFSGFLPALVNVGQTTGVRLAVTLSVGGTLISGELIDAGVFFNELVNEMRAVPEDVINPNAAAQIIALFQRFADRHAGQPGKGEPADENNPHESEHIHLRGARIHLPDGTALLVGAQGLWRVRLNAVDAATLGLPPVKQQSGTGT